MSANKITSKRDLTKFKVRQALVKGRDVINEHKREEKFEKAKRFGDVELDIYPLASTTQNDVISFSATDSMLYIDKTKKRSESAMSHRSTTSAKRVRSTDNIRPLTRNRLREVELEEEYELELHRREYSHSFTQFVPESSYLVQRPHTSNEFKRGSVSPLRYVSNLSENGQILRSMSRPSISPQQRTSTTTGLLTFIPPSYLDSQNFNRSLPAYGNSSESNRPSISNEPHKESVERLIPEKSAFKPLLRGGVPLLPIEPVDRKVVDEKALVSQPAVGQTENNDTTKKTLESRSTLGVEETTYIHEEQKIGTIHTNGPVEENTHRSLTKVDVMLPSPRLAPITPEDIAKPNPINNTKQLTPISPVEELSTIPKLETPNARGILPPLKLPSTTTPLSPIDPTEIIEPTITTEKKSDTLLKPAQSGPMLSSRSVKRLLQNTSVITRERVPLNKLYIINKKLEDDLANMDVPQKSSETVLQVAGESTPTTPVEKRRLKDLPRNTSGSLIQKLLKSPSTPTSATVPTLPTAESGSRNPIIKSSILEFITDIEFEVKYRDNAFLNKDAHDLALQRTEMLLKQLAARHRELQDSMQTSMNIFTNGAQEAVEENGVPSKTATPTTPSSSRSNRDMTMYDLRMKMKHAISMARTSVRVVRMWGLDGRTAL
jgi:hypothetical protein